MATLTDILRDILVASQTNDVGVAPTLGTNATINAAIDQMLMNQRIRRDAQFGIDRLTAQNEEETINQQARQGKLAQLIAESSGIPSSQIIQRQPMEGEGTSPIFTNVVPEVVGRTPEGRPITTFGQNIVGRTGLDRLPAGQAGPPEQIVAGEEPITFEESQQLPQSRITAEQVMQSPEFASLLLQAGQEDKKAQADLRKTLLQMKGEFQLNGLKAISEAVSSVVSAGLERGMTTPEQIQPMIDHLKQQIGDTWFGQRRDSTKEGGELDTLEKQIIADLASGKPRDQIKKELEAAKIPISPEIQRSGNGRRRKSILKIWAARSYYSETR